MPKKKFSRPRFPRREINFEFCAFDLKIVPKNSCNKKIIGAFEIGVSEDLISETNQ